MDLPSIGPDPKFFFFGFGIKKNVGDGDEQGGDGVQVLGTNKKMHGGIHRVGVGAIRGVVGVWDFQGGGGGRDWMVGVKDLNGGGNDLANELLSELSSHCYVTSRPREALHCCYATGSATKRQ